MSDPQLDDNAALHERIAEARRRNQVTQEDVAEACGVNRAAVSQWESADPAKRTTPSIGNLRIFKDLTGVSWDWLLSCKGQNEEISTEEASNDVEPQQDDGELQDQWVRLLHEGLERAGRASIAEKKEWLVRRMRVTSECARLWLRGQNTPRLPALQQLAAQGIDLVTGVEVPIKGDDHWSDQSRYLVLNAAIQQAIDEGRLGTREVRVIVDMLQIVGAKQP